MTNRIRHITIDCHDPFLLAEFWSGVLGFTDDPSEPNVAGSSGALIVDPTGRHPGLLFITVPEEKTAKNRVHLDLQPLSETRDVTVETVIALGGVVADDRRNTDGTGWVVMADPEGNEFCIERSAAERPAEAVVTVVAPEREMTNIRMADEKTALIETLDWYRQGVIDKFNGLSDEAARIRHVRSDSTMAGILKHLALVEDSWFTERFAGIGEPQIWHDVDWEADPNWEFRTALDDPIADLIELYETACERSRSTYGDSDLDQVSVSHTRPFTLRFALIHMIEETARHLGHLDILREITDGVIGE